MAHRKLRSPGLPAPLKALAWLYESLASSQLATVVITLSAAVLAWATWVDSEYGLSAARFGVYESWWFAGLIGLLGVNVLAAALIRFPWVRTQVGFLIVHAGILVLLVGCWIGGRHGVDAQLAVFEGQTSWRAFEDASHFELTVHPRRVEEKDASEKDKATVETIDIPFRPGPFNWEDYASLGWFPWHVTRRDRGTLFQRDGLKLEVLDYCSDSRRRPVPELTLAVSHARSAPKRDAKAWQSLTLAVRQLRSPHMLHHSVSVGAREQITHGQSIVFRMAPGKGETDAFRDSLPEGPLGRLGQLVLHAGGKKHCLLLEDLQGKPPVPLGDTGLKVELVRFSPASLRAHLRVHPADKDAKPGVLLLHAFRTDLDQQDRANGVFGSYWFDAAKKDAAAEAVPPQAIADAAEPRVDIIQGDDLKLYHRAARGSEVEPVAELPRDGSEVVLFEKSDLPLTMYVESFLPAAEPGVNIRPMPFSTKPRAKEPRARVRLTVDGVEEEFWLADDASDVPDERQKLVDGKKRSVEIRLARNQVDLGFQVRLNEFQRKLDPGTSRPSYYASRVDFVDRDDQDKSIREDVSIELNHPVRFTDPKTGRVFRLFQSSFSGPYRPGDPRFDQLVGGSEKRDELFQSIFTAAHDPGRQLKYAGCLMIIAGIAMMYYMKAYFFRSSGRRPLVPPAQGTALGKR